MTKMKWEKMTIFLINMFFSIFLLNENICYGQILSQDQNSINKINKSQEIKENKIEKDKDYGAWKKLYDDTQIKLKKSSNLRIISLIAVAAGGVLVFASQTTKGGGSIGSPPGTPRGLTWHVDLPPMETYKEEILVPGLVLSSAGLVLAIIYRIQKRAALKQKKALEDEGKIKGYLDVKVNPELKRIAFAYKLEF